MEDSIGVKVQVLNTVVLEEAFEKVAGRESQSALHEPREHWDLVGIFLHWIWISRGGAPHVISFSRRKPLFTSASRSSVFALDFFHSMFGFRRGGVVSGVDPWAGPVASSRDLFFPAPVFMLFDGEAIILQVHWVFTRIRSGATLEASSGGTPGSMA
jgi:hypothetical protein